MKYSTLKNLFLSLFIAGAFVFSTSATAKDNGNAQIDINLETIDFIYQVRVPVNPPLHAVKKSIMAAIGLSASEHKNYVVEKEIMTEAAVSFSSAFLDMFGLGVGEPITEPSVSYETLDESKSLKEQGIASGADLRLSKK